MVSIDILAGHDTAATRLRRLQRGLSKLVSGVKFSAFTVVLDALPMASRPLGVNDPYGGVEKPGSCAGVIPQHVRLRSVSLVYEPRLSTRNG